MHKCGVVRERAGHCGRGRAHEREWPCIVPAVLVVAAVVPTVMSKHARVHFKSMKSYTRTFLSYQSVIRATEDKCSVSINRYRLPRTFCVFSFAALRVRHTPQQVPPTHPPALPDTPNPRGARCNTATGILRNNYATHCIIQAA